MLTMVIMLSPPSDFSGGAVELRSQDGEVVERHTLEPGETLSWRGWTTHRVVPLQSGVREVFVVEWWTEADAAVTLDPRGEDSAQGIMHALESDPESAFLFRWLGEAICEQLPCKSPDAAEAAERAYRRAAQLDPKDATTVHHLGYFLLGAKWFGETPRWPEFAWLVASVMVSVWSF